VLVTDTILSRILFECSFLTVTQISTLQLPNPFGWPARWAKALSGNPPFIWLINSLSLSGTMCIGDCVGTSEVNNSTFNTHPLFRTRVNSAAETVVKLSVDACRADISYVDGSCVRVCLFVCLYVLLRRDCCYYNCQLLSVIKTKRA